MATRFPRRREVPPGSPRGAAIGVRIRIMMSSLSDGGSARAGVSLGLLLVGRLDRREHLRLIEAAQDLDVGHDAMAADDSGEVFDGRKELHFLVRRYDLFVILAQSVTVSLQDRKSVV